MFKLRSEVDVNSNKGDTLKAKGDINIGGNDKALEIVIITLGNINENLVDLKEVIRNNTQAIKENHEMITKHIDNLAIHVNKKED